MKIIKQVFALLLLSGWMSSGIEANNVLFKDFLKQSIPGLCDMPAGITLNSFQGFNGMQGSELHSVHNWLLRVFSVYLLSRLNKHNKIDCWSSEDFNSYYLAVQKAEEDVWAKLCKKQKKLGWSLASVVNVYGYKYAESICVELINELNKKNGLPCVSGEELRELAPGSLITRFSMELNIMQELL